MKKSTFMAAYAASPLVPAALYAISMSGTIDMYSASMILGVSAYILLCNQLILASRPAFAVEALGAQGLAALHGSAPLALLAMAVAHRMLKAYVGFDMGSVQAIIGLAALLVLFIGSAAAATFLARPKGRAAESIKAFRAKAAARFGLTYKAARAMHGLVAAAVVALAVHALLASSSTLSGNPLGTGWLVAWTALSLFSYIRYRISGRRPGKAAAQSTPS